MARGLTIPRFSHLVVLSGISQGFPWLSQTLRQITHVLLTRAPLVSIPKDLLPLDLHVLGTPPAFVLSQDQTLQLNLEKSTDF
jgi:hypothetical protein